MAAFNDIRNGLLYKPREGVYFNKKTKVNLLFVTINKSEKEYSPSTMYKDYAISNKLFHWQSQSYTSPDSVKGQRHIRHKDKGVTPLLFIRYSKKDDRGETSPYVFAGPVSLKEWHGNKPINIEWKLDEPLPSYIYQKYSINRN